MLDLANPPRPLDGVILFPDHADASRWYAAGSRVRPTRPGALGLDVFRGGLAGAFLQLELTADPAPEALEAARAALGPDAVIVPVDWVRGQVWVAGRLGEADVAVSAGEPGTAGSTDTVIALRVEQELARILVAALRGDAAPAVVGLHLEGEGLAPALEAEVEADMGAVYDAFAAQGALTTPVGRARMKYLVEDLVKGGAVRVHVADGAGDEVHAAAVERFGEDLVRAAFSPVAMTALSPTLDPAMAQIELQFKLSWRRESAGQHLRWSYRERAARRFSHFVSASLIGWAPDPVAAIREHTVEPDAGALELVAVGRYAEVGVELDAPVSVAVVLTPEAARASVLLAPTARAALRYRVTTTFPPDTLVDAGPRTSDWIAAPGALALVIDPAVVHGLWSAGFELLAAGSGCLGVDLRLTRDGAEASLSLDPAAPRASLGFATAGWRMVRTWRYAADTIVDEAEVVPGTNVLRPPTRQVEVRALLVADADLEAVDLSLIGVGPPAFREALTLSPPDTARSLLLTVPREGPEGWSWTATAVYGDGRTRVESGGPARVLVLGAPAGVRRLAVVLLASPESQGLAAITLSLRAGADTAFAWLEGAATDAVLTLPAAAPSAWNLLVEGLRLDGGRVALPLAGDQALVVVPPFPT